MNRKCIRLSFLLLQFRNFFTAEGFSIFCPFTINVRSTSTRQSQHFLRQHQSSNHEDNYDLSRRDFGVIASVLLGSSLPSSVAYASGLLQFPLTRPLSNTYHFMRAGESLMEANNILSTNPLFVTNREHALSPRGVNQVEKVIQLFEQNNIILSNIRYAIAASSTDTSNLVARALKVGRNSMVPEFNYLEPRAIGAWDQQGDLALTEAAVWALDSMEGEEGRPPPNEDGTPNETLENVAIRLTQFLSVMETQYAGDTVLVIACDGTTLALLSCMMAGIPFSSVHELEYKPGEVQFDVTADSTLALWEERKKLLDQEYIPRLEIGKKELRRLQSSAAEEKLLQQQQRDEENAKIKEAQEERRLEQEKQRELAKQQTEQRQLERVVKRQRTEENPVQTQTASDSIKYGAVGTIGIVAVAILAGSDNNEATSFVDNNNTISTVPNVMDNKAQSMDEKSLDHQGGEILNNSTENFEFNKEDNEETMGDDAFGAERVMPRKSVLGEDTNMTSKSELVSDLVSLSAIENKSGSCKSLPWVTEEDGEIIDDDISHNKTQALSTSMEEYLDQDDGGNDWIQSLVDIMEDEAERNNDYVEEK
mmetsp:Transcript_2147/g.3180  ORF Transcript_2147/g.3180 Transcript_2147/m.3180 type:complete len:593 (-) Transcript_2147:174-1952(-)